MKNFPKPTQHECDHTACMKNIDGMCCHNQCPISNPDYRMPHDVAAEKELHWHETHKIDLKELHNDEE